jgi:hypothetical protein
MAATPVPGSSKYGISKNSFVDFSAMNIPATVAADLAEMGSLSLASKTWSTYTTAERMLSKFHREKRKERKLPLSEETTLEFIHWLAIERKLSAGTINSYLAGIRQLHVAKGLPDPELRSDVVKLVLRGIKNKDNTDKMKHNNVRQPITKKLMALLKKRLRVWDAPIADQRLLWAVATNLFHGAFRVGELLGKKKTEFDPVFDLLTDDIHISAKSIQFRLKMPKEDRKGRSTIVDVYATGSPLCPVRALAKWKAMNTHWPAGQPAFRWRNGSPLTANEFGNILDSRLAGFIDNPRDIFCTHSFRIGVASMLGSLGYDDEDIQAVGRWSSRAFEEYLMLPRTKRMAIAKRIKL